MGQTASTPAPPAASAAIPAGCPMHEKPVAPAPPPPAQCPVPHNGPSSSSSSSKAAGPSGLAACPVPHDARTAGALNPLNQMPELAQTMAPGQTDALPTDRTTSTIRRGAEERWEYPSPQQFYNALVRKGWETPVDAIETMVQIHNFLNEEAWLEVLQWEHRRGTDLRALQLARFQGRPGELSPKARFWLFAGWLLPTRFNTEPPFDRHDWVVKRPDSGEEVRYVIDYYSAPPEPDGSPVFSLDVRPALDSFASVKERISVATEEAWSSFREQRAQAEPAARSST